MTRAAERPSTDSLIGSVVGGEFRIEEKIGSGGMGSVYRAVQKLTERDVAIKVLHQHLCDEVFQRRFQQEAQIISRLNHPNIITVFKYGQNADGTLYIAMEFVRGVGLADVLGSGQPIEIDRALPLMVQIADAVAYANEQKIVHRDLKPENMILTRTGRTETVKILDFGIAKLVDGNASITKTGMLCGSPMYMAPEQWAQARDIDGRTDVYALGCMFYEMLTGRMAFAADSVVDYMMAHTKGALPKPPREVGHGIGTTPALSDAIMKCIQRDRADRFPDAYALLEALKTAQIEFDTAERRFAAAGSVRPARSAGVSASPVNSPATRQPTLAQSPRSPAGAPVSAARPTSAARPLSPLVPGAPPRPAPRPHVATKVLTSAETHTPDAPEAPVELKPAPAPVPPRPPSPVDGKPPVHSQTDTTAPTPAVDAETAPIADAAPAAPESLAPPAEDPVEEHAPPADLGPLREVENRFRTTAADRESDPAMSQDSENAAPDPRLHVLLVLTGAMLCASLAAAVVLLR